MPLQPTRQQIRPNILCSLSQVTWRGNRKGWFSNRSIWVIFKKPIYYVLCKPHFYDHTLDSSKSHHLSLMTALHTLGILSTSFTWNAFSNSLERVPTYAEHLLAAFPSPCRPTHPKPSQLGWSRDCGGQVIWCSTPSLLSTSNSPYTAWRCVLGQCPIEKQMIVPLNANQMG
jgi:hypothetical protein